MVESSASILSISSHLVIENLEQVPVLSAFNILPDEFVEFVEFVSIEVTFTSSGIGFGIHAQ